MAYLSLYRKWRPRTFDEIAGQSHVIQTLKNAIDKGRISHAYLFCGPRGTGKTTTARILAKAINCAKGSTSTPCNECESCRSIIDGSSIDVLELDAASNRKVDEIRDLLEKIPYTSAQGGKKVYIVDEVHMLTPESFNTLLKTLEEPPEHVIFVLATTEPQKVLPTILSRCQRFDFRRIAVPDIEARLREVASAEGIDIDDGALALIAHHAQGALRDALGSLEQLASYVTEKVAASDVTSLLGLTDSELLLNFTDILVKGDLAGGILFVDGLIDKGVDIRQFVQDVLGHLRNLFLIQTVPDMNIYGVPDEHLEKFAEQAKSVPARSLMFFINTLNEVYNQSRWATDIRLLFEIALFKMVNAGDDISTEGILYRIERLESAISNGVSLPSEGKVLDMPETGKKAGRKQSPEATSEVKTDIKEPGAHVDLEMIKKIWPQVLKLVKEKKPSRYGFYTAAKLDRVEDGKLVLTLKESDKAFVGSVEGLKLLQGALKTASGISIPVSCELDKNSVRTVAVTDPSIVSGDPLPADDYIKLVQDAFGAKIVEEISINKTKNQEDR